MKTQRPFFLDAAIFILIIAVIILIKWKAGIVIFIFAIAAILAHLFYEFSKLGAPLENKLKENSEYRVIYIFSKSWLNGAYTLVLEGIVGDYKTVLLHRVFAPSVVIEKDKEYRALKIGNSTILDSSSIRQVVT